MKLAVKEGPCRDVRIALGLVSGFLEQMPLWTCHTKLTWINSVRRPLVDLLDHSRHAIQSSPAAPPLLFSITCVHATFLCGVHLFLVLMCGCKHQPFSQCQYQAKL
eukprot:scaffold47905_cov20-Tisochrysis_lutea.AAC.3